MQAVGDGSSPRAWGIRRHETPSDTGRRFIPTCVGNTSRRASSAFRPSVHPHVRGEYPARVNSPVWQRGSSPRAWGILSRPGRMRQAARFIPTCVGNTSMKANMVSSVAVHPHVRGEYCWPSPAWKRSPGSSPRAWGIPGARRNWPGYSRFIPTCVGNTSPRSPASGSHPVHPHVRGEYVVKFLGISPGGGSSPRAWGIL